MKRLLCLLLLANLFASVHAQDLSQYEKKLFIRGNDTLRYRILYPLKYKKGKRYPLVVFLHGSGERGNNNEAQLTHGGKLFLKDEIRKDFRSIVIFPQCPDNNAWSRFRGSKNAAEWTFDTESGPTKPQLLVKQLVDELVAEKEVNSKKIYLGGLSLGGIGTYDLLMRYPGFFAAAFPICGAVNVSDFIKKSSVTPLWIFHGGMDEAVSPKFSRELYTALIARGAKNVLYTEYPKAGHNSWDSAFAEPALLQWIFSAKKKNNIAAW